jgi:hypothetical protein
MTRPRLRQFNLQINTDQHLELEVAAATLGISISEFARRAISATARKGFADATLPVTD